MIFALSIGLLAVFNGEVRKFNNKWFILIPIYLLFSLMMSPHFDMYVNNVESGDFYFWKPFSQVLCFALMIFAVSGIKINFEEIIKVMVICGTVMAGYVILQKLGLDQFWMPKQGGEFTSVRSYTLGGNLGQPTLLSSWLVMMVPLAFYLKKYWMAFLMIAACLLTQGAMVLMSLGLIFLITIFYLYKEIRKPLLGILIFLSIIGLFLFFGNKHVRDIAVDRMDGRSEVWKNTIKDIRDGQIDASHKYPLTGIGFGRFPFISPDRHKSIFCQVHNDPLEFAYDCGIFGEYLLIAGISFMIITVCSNLTPLVFSILLSFIAILFCSLGSFPFQLGAHQFYASLLVGFLNNDSIIRRI